MKYKSKLRLILAFTIIATCVPPGYGAKSFITLASTTSTQHSGLYEVLLPIFAERHDIAVRVVAVGTGKAIRLAENGDADVLIVHHKPSEMRFVEAGFGVRRHDLMYNEFVIAGPATDPAGIEQAATGVEALSRIAASESPFMSRGDESGTHRKERELWQETGVKPDPATASWYRETGTGMGSTLNVASAINAYVLSDIATWLRFANKGELRLLYDGDPKLVNQYGLIRVSEERHPHVKAKEAETFVSWLLSDAGQAAINRYEIAGQQAFVANATISSD